MGLMAMICRASICSVTRMVPNSAAMAEPARALTIRAVITGPISRARDRATMPAHQTFPAELSEAVVALQGQDHAGEEPGQDDDKEGFDPHKLHLFDHVSSPERRDKGQAKARKNIIRIPPNSRRKRMTSLPR